MKTTYKKTIEILIKSIKGMIIGVSLLTAGGATFAIILGIYDRCMEIIAKPFKNFRNNLIYITPILFGIGVSVVLLKNNIVYLYENYTHYVQSVFLGIVLGGVPTLIKKANMKGKSKKHYIALFIAFVLTLIGTYFANKYNEGTGIESKMGTINIAIYGTIYGIGAILPGMTTLHILIYLGVWSRIMAGALSINIEIIIPFAIGFIIPVLLIANLMTYCFKNFYGYTYYAIIGFSITSLIMLIPKVYTIKEIAICLIITIASLVAMYYSSKIAEKKEIQKT